MSSRRELKNLKKVLQKVKESEEKIKNLSDGELTALTDAFRERYRNGESLDSILPQ